MEENQKKDLYFIFCQKGTNNTVKKMETSLDKSRVEIEEQKVLNDTYYILYHLLLPDDSKEKPFALTLTCDSGKDNDKLECYMSYIQCKKDEIFKYNLNFIPIYENNSSALNQTFLPYLTQFEIFHERIKQNEDKENLISLFLNTIDYISEKKTYDIESNFLVRFFIEIDKLEKKENKKLILENFFEKINFNKIFENYLTNSEFEKIDVSNVELKFLKNSWNNLVEMFSDNEKIRENIDIFILYYLYYKNSEFFFNVLFDNPDKQHFEKIKDHLLAHKKIFKNFSSEILNSCFLIGVPNFDSLLLMIKYFIPSMQDVLGLLADEFFIDIFFQKQGRYSDINVLELHTPQKTDETEKFYDYLQKINSNQLSSLKIKFSEDFFYKYCELYKNNDYKKINALYKFFQLHKNINKNIKTIEDDIIKCYHETGLYLIEQKELYNKEMFNFLENDEYLSEEYRENRLGEILKIISLGIRFEHRDSDFINNILNNKDIGEFNVKNFFGKLYGEFIKNIFSKITTPEELMNLTDCKLTYRSLDEVLENFILMIERVWCSNPVNFPESILRLIAQSFAFSSFKLKKRLEKVYKSLENKIPNYALLPMYSLILYNQYDTSDEFKTHLIEYIENNCGENALSVWYLFTIRSSEDENIKIEFLKNNLIDKFTVKVEDFFGQTNESKERIKLFQYLRASKNLTLLLLNSIETSYYKKSINSIYDIFNLKFKDAIKIYRKSYDLTDLFFNFTPIEKLKEEAELDVHILQIQFSEKVEPLKNFYDLLWCIYNYWEFFFAISEKDNISKLKNIIEMLDNSSLDDFKNKKDQYQFYLDKYLKEAQDGEQLKDSLFFMAIYDDIQLKNKNINEKERYNQAKDKFFKLKDLSIDNDINSLDADLKNIIIESIQKNIVRLNNELNFINNYFFKNPEKQEKNEKENLIKYKNFNTKKIKREILKLVKQIEKDKEDNEIVILDEEEKDKIDNNIDIIEDEEIKKKNSQKIILEKRKELIEKMHKLEQEYIKTSKYAWNKNKEKIKEILKKHFYNFFKNLFEKNFGFATLKNEFNDKIINYSKNIFMNNVEFDLLKEEKIYILISEFFDVLEQLEKNGRASEKIIFSLLQIMNEFQSNFEQDKLGNILTDLFSLIKENIKEEEYINLLIKLLIKEAIKGNKNQKIYTDLLKLIFPKNNITKYEFLFDDLSPFIDIILGKDFTECLNLDSNSENNTIKIIFRSSCFSVLENIYGNKNKIEEMLLFYFETKISTLLNNYNENNDLFNEYSRKHKYLEHFLFYLEDLIIHPKKNNENDYILKLYAIAYIKSFYSIQIKYLFENLYQNLNYKNIFIELYNGQMNNFKISMMIYILKLAFNLIGNIYEFAHSAQLRYQNFRSIFKPVINQVKEAGYFEFDYLLDNEYGFDFFIFPNKNVDKFLEVFNNIIKLNRQKIYNEDIITNINALNDIDLFYCFLVNIRLSFNYHSEYKNDELIKFIELSITNKKFAILKDNDLVNDILELLINNEKYENKILKGFNSNKTLSYDQLLCILISFRFVLNFAQLNNKEGLFYYLLNEPTNTFNINKELLNLYLDESFREQREINYLTYKIIKFVIYSHLCIRYLLGKINLNDTNEILRIEQKKNEKKYILCELNNEFNSIKNILNTLSIKNIIIFMNSIFDDILNTLNTIKNNSQNNNEFKKIEQNLDNIINNKISSYKTSVEEYYTLIEKIEKGNNSKNNNGESEYNKPAIFYDILFEKDSVYNDKKLEKNHLPYLSYLTYTNSCDLDDFKNQFLFENDTKSYPIIDFILKDNKILKLIEFIPELNNFVNKYYNELSMNITEEEANKNISNLYPNMLDFDKFNKKLDYIFKFSEEKIFNFKYKNDSKISEIININSNENKLNKIYQWIINEYNKFLETMNFYEEKKKYIKEVIIQNCAENECISLINNGKTIQERLNEIIYLYSKRERINKDNKINVYNGGKIIYNFELIEDMLEKEFVLCKRKFSQKQKLFIFTNKIFSDKNNKILLDLNDKYPQIEISNEDSNKKIIPYLNRDENILKSIYYNCLYLIIYLMIYLKNEKFKCEETNIVYIMDIMQKENNNLNEVFISLIENSNFKINQILSLYEIIEEKAFNSLTQKLKEKLILDQTTNLPKEKEKEIQNEISNNSILNEDLLIKTLKKYIVRYCLGDNSGINNWYNIKLDDEFNKIDVWDKNIFNNEKFKEDKNKLISINNEDNCLLNYLFMKIFEIVENDDQFNNDDQDTSIFD